MSLKAFHLFFICASILLSGGFGGWCFAQYGVAEEKEFLVMGIASITITFALFVYLPWFFKKSRGLGYLALLLPLVVPLNAHACAVCFGDPKSPLVESANAGVVFMLAVVASVLLSIGGTLFYWNRVARR